MMKGKKLLAGALLVLALMLLCGAAMADSLRFGTVDGARSVNLRASATSRSQKLGEYEEGTWMRILSESGNWYRVVGPDGRTGWMSKEYVYITAGAKGTIGILDASGAVNLRKSASYDARVLGQYRSGTPCILLSQSNGWYHVSIDGKNGYVDASYVDKKYMTYSPDVATIVTTNGGALRMRKGPGTSYGTVKSFKNGSYVMILQKGDGWWKVAAGGYVGYMDSRYLKDGITNAPSGSSGGSGSSGSSGGSGSSGSGTTPSSGYGVVSNPGKNQKLYLRQSASKKSRSLGSYGNGVQVTILEHGKTWCKVKVDGKTGYMMTQYLDLYNVPATPVMYADHPDRTFVNLRNAPSQSTGRVLTRVPHGAKVTVITPGKTWTEVRYNGYTGYMMTKFLDD